MVKINYCVAQKLHFVFIHFMLMVNLISYGDFGSLVVSDSWQPGLGFDSDGAQYSGPWLEPHRFAT